MMKIFHALAAVLFLLKVLGVINVSWWTVAVPSIIALIFTLLIFLFALIAVIADNK